MKIRTTAVSLAIISILAACGGGGGTTNPGGGGTTEYIEFFDTTSSQTITLKIDQLNPTASTVSSNTGTLNWGTDRATISGLSGDIQPNDTTVVLDAAAGTITFSSEATSYVTTFAAEPVGTDPFFGVVGVPTQNSDLPTSGTLRAYVGSSGIQIISSDAVYDLTGSATAQVEFGSGGTVDLVFDNLSGSKTDGVSAPVNVTDVATIGLNAAQITDGSFSGGTATFSSTGEISTTLTGSESIATSGSFFGPDADELGGVFIVDDTSGAGSLLIQGGFVAD
jgi:hypothetical protein